MSPAHRAMPWSARCVLWLNQQAREAYQSLYALSSESISTWMIMLMLGLSLSLPSAMHVVTKNVQIFHFLQQEATQINLFLDPSINQEELSELEHHLTHHLQIEDVNYISQKQALNDFETSTGIQDLMQYLDQNPLPPVFVVQPQSDIKGMGQLSALVGELSIMPHVEQAKMNMNWLIEVQRVLDIIYTVVYSLSGLLLSVVLLIIHNTVRLSISHQKQQIKVMKLVGATDHYIRRPFLFACIWYGIVAGSLAWCTINLLTWVFKGYVSQDWPHYSQQIIGLDLQELSLLIGTAIVLGSTASYLSLKRYLGHIQPD